MIQEIITYPDSLIDRRIDRRGVTIETVIILVCGILGSIGLGYVGVQALSAVGGDAAQLRFKFIGAALRPLIVLVVVWVWYALASHVLAGQFGGRSPLVRVFRASAWALVPIGIWYLIRSIVTVALFFGVDFPANPDGLDSGSQLHSILQLGLDSPVYLVTLLIGLIFVAWSWQLLAHGIEVAKGIDADDARKVAAVPVGVYGLYVLYTVLQAAGVA